ncbi:hypothetical protein ABH935_008614 [Catenulispora sp. GAS73]
MQLPTLTVGSLYLPAGEVGTERQAEKERFMEAFHTHLATLNAEAAETGRAVLICGDWNIAHQEADIKNWKANQKNSGFLPEERQRLSTVLSDAGYVDVVRTLHRGPVLVVELPRQGLRQRQRLADRLPDGVSQPRGARLLRGSGVRRELCGAVV